jgi:hypothetical protein
VDERCMLYSKVGFRIGGLLLGIVLKTGPVIELVRLSVQVFTGRTSGSLSGFLRYEVIFFGYKYYNK